MNGSKPVAPTDCAFCGSEMRWRIIHTTDGRLDATYQPMWCCVRFVWRGLDALGPTSERGKRDHAAYYVGNLGNYSNRDALVALLPQ